MTNKILILVLLAVILISVFYPNLLNKAFNLVSNFILSSLKATTEQNLEKEFIIEAYFNSTLSIKCKNCNIIVNSERIKFNFPEMSIENKLVELKDVQGNLKIEKGNIEIKGKIKETKIENAITLSNLEDTQAEIRNIKELKIQGKADELKIFGSYKYVSEKEEKIVIKGEEKIFYNLDLNIRMENDKIIVEVKL